MKVEREYPLDEKDRKEGMCNEKKNSQSDVKCNPCTGSTDSCNGSC